MILSIDTLDEVINVHDMKLCVSTLTCPAWPLDQIMSAARFHNLGGIDLRGIAKEIDITRLPEFGERVGETLTALCEQGLKIPCFNTSITLLAPGDRWQQMLDECQRHASLAMQIGTRFIRVFGGEVPQRMTRDEATSMAQRRLRQISKICVVNRCQPILQTHDDWATARDVLEVVHEFHPAEAGVLWDIEQTWRHGEAPMETALALRRHLLHVHIKDSLHADGKNVQVLLGEGDIPIAGAVQALKEVGYAGWYCLETDKRWQPEAPAPEISIPHFVQFMSALTGGHANVAMERSSHPIE